MCPHPPGASTAGVHSHGPHHEAEPGDRGQRALLPGEDPALPHDDWLHGHHHDGEAPREKGLQLQQLQYGRPAGGVVSSIPAGSTCVCVASPQVL